MICKNCGTEFEGNFCNHCGQKSTVERLTWKSVWDNILHGIFHVDNTFVKTTRTLVVHPDRLISDYFAGRRKGYMAPIPLLAVWCVILLFFGHIEGGAGTISTIEGSATHNCRALYFTHYRHGSVHGVGCQDCLPQGRCCAVQLGRVSAGLLLPVGVVYFAFVGVNAYRVGVGRLVLYGVWVDFDGSLLAPHLLGGVFVFPR